ncbi:putative protein [Geobacter sp. OR-1]|uniref:patatin-like phospholipase family protein n=1 Tax=Geobacter sp. OR-1 TaxID=1266765 RepID=UPI000542EFB0|nr:patatin-like phospholipase family protein [Geobacter sp. OR-1]GAM10154.1 putative protein [Geobacter sp. OR-1]
MKRIWTGLSVVSIVALAPLLIQGCSHTKPIAPAAKNGPAACAEPFRFDKNRGARQFDLVFEGGGAKGTVFVGALQEFQQRNITGKRFVGTSAGAITATLLAAGYTADEMLAAVNEKTPAGKPRFSTFMDIPGAFDRQDILDSYTYKFFGEVDMPFISKRSEEKIDEKIFAQLMEHDRYRILFSFIERGGVYEGKKFHEWLTEKLDAGCRNLGNATLKEFSDKTGNELTVVASDTTAQEKLVLNSLTAPDCPVAWAVRMSMSIPFVWQEVRWQKDWGRYRGQDITGHTIVDGGVISNFPLDLVAASDPKFVAIMGTTGAADAPQLGLLIDEKIEVPDAAGTEPKASKGILDEAKELKTVKRLMRLVDTMTDANDKFVMSIHPDKVCRLPAKGYGTTEFDMSDQRVELLIKAGRDAARQCLDRMRLDR